MHLPLYSSTSATTTCCATRDASGACFSHDRRFRYALWRRWGPGKLLVFCGLNCSIADEVKLDPTLRRVAGFARNLGYDGFEMLNLFPFVSTDRSKLVGTLDRDGEPGRNDEHILDAVSRGDQIILGFGGEPARPSLRYAVGHLRELLSTTSIPVTALEVNDGGLPTHPLYLLASLRPKPYVTWPEWCESDAQKPG